MLLSPFFLQSKDTFAVSWCSTGIFLLFFLADVGFEIPNRFVVGYALDYNEYFRDLNVSSHAGAHGATFRRAGRETKVGGKRGKSNRCLSLAAS